ncbi:beta-ketoacyl-[acyl-carrier-protein] synthase family protein [Spirillospora sp. CA-294931]|uniref:beta-ketoacyl-[acyl-carrier-protein] synthase family protein n=1 Tax=Spirillospora sp. CA-294931 TaxID=3240042 RepID=UPI003D91F60B
MTARRHRVVVTGLGVRTPAGSTPKELWNTLSAAASTARTITSFDTDRLPVDFACQIHDFDPSAYLSLKQARRLDRCTQLAFCAATDALSDATDGSGAITVPAERRAVIAGTGIGSQHTQEQALLQRDEYGHGKLRALHVPMIMPNAAAAVISMSHDITGPSMTVSTACASGTFAIGQALNLIRDGHADMAVAGGAEANVTPNNLLAFHRCRALSRRVDDPRTASRPFDTDRDGFVLGEGAAFLVLENLEGAVRRGAQIYAELTGYAATSDAYHLVTPRPDGDGAYQCMRTALGNARRTPAQVTHINAHGTSTSLNDLGEAQAISRLFGDRAVPVTATKSITGHAMGGAGAIEAAVVALTLRHQLIHPTANLHTQDPACDIDLVTRPRPLVPGVVLSNSFGFGGHNGTLVFEPVPA